MESILVLVLEIILVHLMLKLMKIWTHFKSEDPPEENKS